MGSLVEQFCRSTLGKRAKSNPDSGPQYPADHQPAMRVPEGGSSCASCRYLQADGDCGNRFYIKWNGSGTIPAPVDQFCSDWYEPKDEAATEVSSS